MAKKLIALDPGKNTGIALFDGPELAYAFLAGDVPAPFELVGRGPVDPSTVLIIEIPRVYPGARSEDPNDLIGVAICAGRWIEYLGCNVVQCVHPQDWKASVPKAVHNQRVLAKLTEKEKCRLPSLPKTKLHNVIDAVGLGLFALGRMQRGK